MSDLINPLQALLQQAGNRLPARTGAVDRVAERLHRLDGPQILLADVSGSMAAPAWGGRRKIDVLREAVTGVRTRSPYHLMAFASQVMDGLVDIPEPEGTTRLDLGLAAALRHQPRATLVISDGQPDDEQAALDVAARLPGRIDVLYVGPDGDRAAMEFLQRLARVGCGGFQSADLSRAQPALAHTIHTLMLSR